VAGYTSSQCVYGFVAKIGYNSTVTSVKNIKSQELENFMKVFPNPSSGIFQLSCFLNETCDLTMNITDAKGQRVHSEYFSSCKGNFSKNIDLGKNAKGIYFVELVVGSKRLIKKLVVIDYLR
jgi:hypothetical protein